MNDPNYEFYNIAVPLTDVLARVGVYSLKEVKRCLDTLREAAKVEPESERQKYIAVLDAIYAYAKEVQR